MTSDTVLVVGTGLIGTSIGLALRDARRVLLADTSPEHLATAVRRGAGLAWDGHSTVDLLVLATPPDAIAAAYAGVHHRSRAVTHVSSIQSRVLSDLRAAGAEEAVLCGGHPLAGRETAGPDAAAADLFDGRPWAVCPTEATSPAAQLAVTELARDCGAEPVVLTATEHDRAVALVSHLPHLAASATAARLDAADPGTAALSGPGLQDTTRIAAGDPQLWSQILLGNAGFVAPVVHKMAADLLAVARALEAGDRQGVLDLLVRGTRGRQQVPVKRGHGDEVFARVAVSVPDAPGQLAAVFSSAGAAGVNIEDVRVEHLPGRPTGLLELLVNAGHQQALRSALSSAGFTLLPQD